MAEKEKEKIGDKIVDFFTSNPFKSPKKDPSNVSQKDVIKRENSLKRDTSLRTVGSIMTTIQKDGSLLVQRPPAHHAATTTTMTASSSSSHATSGGSPRPASGKPPSGPPVTTSFRRLDVGVRKQMSAAECLAAVNAVLAQLRAMPPNDIRAFPLLNEGQRLVQQLRDATTGVQATDRDAWL